MTTDKTAQAPVPYDDHVSAVENIRNAAPALFAALAEIVAAEDEYDRAALTNCREAYNRIDRAVAASKRALELAKGCHAEAQRTVRGS